MVPGTAVSIPMDTVAAGYFTGVVDTPRRGPVAQMAAGTCYGREIVLVIIVNIHIIPPELIHNLSVKAERPFCSITKNRYLLQRVLFAIPLCYIPVVPIHSNENFSFAVKNF